MKLYGKCLRWRQNIFSIYYGKNYPSFFNVTQISSCFFISGSQAGNMGGLYWNSSLLTLGGWQTMILWIVTEHHWFLLNTSKTFYLWQRLYPHTKIEQNKRSTLCKVQKAALRSSVSSVTRFWKFQHYLRNFLLSLNALQFEGKLELKNTNSENVNEFLKV